MNSLEAHHRNGRRSLAVLTVLFLLMIAMMGAHTMRRAAAIR